jgi:hypothetical protein
METKDEAAEMRGVKIIVCTPQVGCDHALFTDSNNSSLEGTGTGSACDVDANAIDSASTATIRMLSVILDIFC